MITESQRIKDLSLDCCLEDLSKENYIPVDGPDGTKKLSMEVLNDKINNPVPISDLEILALD